MPAPLRTCETCRNYAPYKGSARLRETFGKCTSGKRPVFINFADTARGDPALCGSDGLWWEPRPPAFEVIDEEPLPLRWDDEDDEAA